MKKTSILALMVTGLWIMNPAAADAQIEGVWELTFDTSPTPLSLTMTFVEVTIFFVGTTGAPDNCSWGGVRLPLQGNSALVTGFMSCGTTTPTFGGFLFGTSSRNSMEGVMLTSFLDPPFVAFAASKTNVTERRRR